MVKWMCHLARKAKVRERDPGVRAQASSSSGTSSSSGEDSDNSQSSGSRSELDMCLLPKRSTLKQEREFECGLFGDDSDDLSGEDEVDDEELELGMGAQLALEIGFHEKDEPLEVSDGYPAHLWEQEQPTVYPGQEGFNKRCTAVMRNAKLSCKLHATFDATAACPPLQPHQEAVGFMLHPKSPVTRILVDHPTGSGKTREMIRVLDNFFFDIRPKVPIFPKHPVCRNFYMELLRWPNRYRDYFCCEQPADAAAACGKRNWKEARHGLWDLGRLPEEECRRLCVSLRDVLEMKHMLHMGRVRRACRVAFQKRHPGESMPGSPLRAISYTSAGGSFTQVHDCDLPRSALMKVGYTRGSGNVYTGKIVIMDEVHNLVRTQTKYGEQLGRLRDLLYGAEGMVLAGFTGTPIPNDPAEGRQLLDVIKGKGAPPCDEGFLSSFPMRPRPLFPLSLPRGVPDALLTEQRRRNLVRKVELHAAPLSTYDRKRRLDLPERVLCAYCNLCAFHGCFHDSVRERILASPMDCSPKLYTIAEDVAATQQKCLVMTSRQTGYVAMLEIMRIVAESSDPPFKVATMDELAEFNHVSNIRGEAYRVLVADATQCSEGVSFFAVRQAFLADVPSSPSQFIQQCGRSIRMYGHRGLPQEEQTVTTHLYVSTLPKWMRTSLACFSLRALRRPELRVTESAVELEDDAKALYARFQHLGISTLEELKARLDAHGAAKQKSLPGWG